MKSNITQVNIKILFLIIFLTCFNILQAQENTYRIYFINKSDEQFVPGSQIYNNTLKTLSEKSIKRRLKVRSIENLITLEDAPVNKSYIDSLAKFDIYPILTLNWNNYIVVRTDTLRINKIRDLSFIKKIQSTSEKMSVLSSGNYKLLNKTILTDQILIRDFTNCDKFEYGLSFPQSDMLGITKLHSYGFSGDNVLIGFMDTGFRWRTHNAIKDANVIAEHDYIFNDSITANQPEDDNSQDNHGTMVFSTVAGYSNGNLIGIAPKANFILAKTEYIPSETRLEEDNYVAALEWFERMGADISSSSIGYFKFDTTESRYSYSELNGNTTIIASAINKAVSKGMVCITAAGNEGPTLRTLITPADADSVITVAAVTSDGKTPANFSSRGPRADGVIKPDIAAMGVQVITVSPTTQNDFSKANGTSFATPIMAGATGIILSIYPDLKPWEIRNILFTNTTNKQKNDTIGYGVPNIYEAIIKNGIATSKPSTFPELEYQRIFTYILSENLIDKPEIEFFDPISKVSIKDRMSPTAIPFQYSYDLPIKEKNVSQLYRIKAHSSNFSGCYPPNCNEYDSLQFNETRIQCGVNPKDLQRFETNDDAFVYPSVVDNNANQITFNLNLKNSSQVNINIFSSDGRKVTSDVIEERNAGIISKNYDVRLFSSGVYFIHYQYLSKSGFVSFIKIN